MTKEEWQRQNRILAARETELQKQLVSVNKTIQNLKTDFNKLDDKGPLAKAKAIDAAVNEKGKIEKELSDIKKTKQQNDQLRINTAKKEKLQELKDTANIAKKFAKELSVASLEGVAALQGHEKQQLPVNELVVEMPSKQTALEKAIEQGKKPLQANSEAGDVESALKEDKKDKLEQQKREEEAYKKENNTKDLTKEKVIDPDASKKQQEQERQARIEQRAKDFLENKQMTNSHKPTM